MAALPGIELKERTMLTCKEREDIQVDPIPRHVHPVHHAGRRVARARAIIRGIRNRDATFFVDAAEYHCETAFAVAVVDGGGNPITTATIRTNSVSVAEEAAIALALQAATTPATIYSDSRTAVRAFSAGTVSSLAARIVRASRNNLARAAVAAYPTAVARATQARRASVPILCAPKRTHLSYA
ncbi:hypothetical protein HPB50_011902 [Hyalomma asiaticum]|uniref:Uncharacterized protein n=1 Tax=Hyalomma asiaticum TaxID=266040 RepID=A0ACB7SGC0_HYAAI|nr:hypothetical protein HPB50_011902 [Hyalomma asiaticum]